MRLDAILPNRTTATGSKRLKHTTERQHPALCQHCNGELDRTRRRWLERARGWPSAYCCSFCHRRYRGNASSTPK